MTIHPIKFTIENKNGVQTRIPSEPIEVFLTKGCMVIKSTKPINSIVKKCVIQKTPSYLMPYGCYSESPYRKDVPVEGHFNIKEDLVFELAENSKIEVILFSDN